MKSTNLNKTSAKEQKWLSLDRKWNIFFHISMSLSVTLGWYFISHLDSTKLGITIIVTSLLLIPYICVHFNGIKVEHKNRIFNSQGMLLNKQRRPHKDAFGYFFLANFFALWLPGWFGANPSIIHFFIIFSALCSYFIYIDCPIAYLFDLNIYPEKKQQSINFVEEHRRRMDNYHNNTSINPKYRNLPSNSLYTSSTDFRRPR